MNGFNRPATRRRTGTCRCRIAALVCITAMASAIRVGHAAPWVSQHSAAPYAEPVVSADAYLAAQRALAWTDQGAQHLLLEHEVTIRVGTYGFTARRAVARIDQEQQPGRVISYLSVYLQDARPLRGVGPVTAEGPRMLVTSSTTGKVHLRAFVEHRSDPPDDPLVHEAARRIQGYRRALESRGRDLAPAPPTPAPPQTPPLTPHAPRRQVKADPVTKPPVISTAPDAFLPDDAVVTINWQNLVYRPTDDGHMAMLHGGANVAFQTYDEAGQSRGVNLSCQNAVIFLDENAQLQPGANQLRAENVRGVYLEQNVVLTDGTYTVRAPRAYYDPSTQRAVVLDAVFFTWDVTHKVPIYVRAEKLRQTSAHSWTTGQSLVTTSEFAEPHFAIAARELSLELRRQTDGSHVVYANAKDIEPRVGNFPLGRLPGFAGKSGEIPLRSIDTRYSDNTGPEVRTRWNLFALAGIEPTKNVDLTGDIDFLGEHGAAFGVHGDYDKPDLYGNLGAYLMADDDGDDDIGGRTVGHDGDTRGYVHGQHRQDVGDQWELLLELSFVSDVTFLEEFFRSEAEATKPYETSIYLKYQELDQQFSLLAQYDLDRFTPQTTTLQAPGYDVEKLPELGYFRVGTSLLDDRITYYTENILSRMRTRIGEDAPIDRGFSLAESLVTFGIPNRLDFDDALATIPGSYVGRFDTRHELQFPIVIGPIDVVPYLAGRATFYDDSFKKFGGEGDRQRLWGAVGTRLHTSVSKVYEGVHDQVLNLHRLRHVIEPTIDLFASHATLDGRDLPVFDPEVESITEGSGVRLGLRNRLQTQRGGPGRWRNVDWVVINTDFVLRSDNADTSAEPARFFSYRPEFSPGRDHFYADLAWSLSDYLAVSADLTHSFEEDETSQIHAGAVITHTPRLSSSIDYTNIDVIDDNLLSAGLSYELTSKYQLGLRQRWDLNDSSSRSTDVILERKLPRWTLLTVFSVDDIDEDTSIAVVLIPDGVPSSRRLGRFGR